jgi:hypothetical protein
MDVGIVLIVKSKCGRIIKSINVAQINPQDIALSIPMIFPKG